MTRRTRDPLYLEQSPLIFALAQVRFSPRLTIGERIPAFQEHVRIRGFPRYEQQQIRSIEVGRDVTQSEHTRWLFQNRDRSASVLLTQDFIVLETNAYDTFEKFIELILPLLEGLRDIVDVTDVERIGLRYVDLIRPEPSQSLGMYLRSSILGLSAADLGVERLLYRFESVGITDSGSRVVVKVHQFDDGSILPPDLRENTLDYSRDLAEFAGVTTLLDIDHFVLERSDFTAEGVIDKLWKLHDTTDTVFRASVTPDARRAWGETTNARS